MRESLAKRKKLIKKLSESQLLIEQLEEHIRSEEFDLMVDNEKITKRLNLIKKEHKQAIVRMGVSRDEKGNTILARDQVIEELRITQQNKLKNY